MLDMLLEYLNKPNPISYVIMLYEERPEFVCGFNHICYCDEDYSCQCGMALVCCSSVEVENNDRAIGYTMKLIKYLHNRNIK